MPLNCRAADPLLPADLNNCGCAENHFDADTVDLVMRGSVKMLADQGWDGVKFDSCSMFHNLTKWAELINATGRPVLIENCHQGAYTPGMQQWQGCVPPCIPLPLPQDSGHPCLFCGRQVREECKRQLGVQPLPWDVLRHGRRNPAAARQLRGLQDPLRVAQDQLHRLHLRVG